MVKRFVPRMFEVKIFDINQNRVKIVKGLIDRYHIVFFSSSISVTGPDDLDVDI